MTLKEKCYSLTDKEFILSVAYTQRDGKMGDRIKVFTLTQNDIDLGNKVTKLINNMKLNNVKSVFFGVYNKYYNCLLTEETTCSYFK